MTSDEAAPTLYVVRSEPDSDQEYHCDALSAAFPAAPEVEFVAGETVPLDDADGVVLSGSTAGVYEADRRAWIGRQEALVRNLVDREIPTLGVCFGHQIANSALGGAVEPVETTEGLVDADFDDDPLFDGVSPPVVSLHGDQVTEPGAGMAVTASADHAPVFATCHRSAPLWTVQFHPELTGAHRERLVEKDDWDPGRFSFEDLTAPAVFENFRRLAAERTGADRERTAPEYTGRQNG